MEPNFGLGEKDKVFYMTNDEFRTEIKTEYAREIGNTDPEDLYDHYNPGPTLSNGGVNFECHCVSHLVASPCGHEFREAITCQKTASEEQLENGACADEFMKFMECVIRTDCFRTRSNNGSEESNGKERSEILGEKRGSTMDGRNSLKNT